MASSGNGAEFRLYIDCLIRDSSPTHLETVHGHIFLKECLWVWNNISYIDLFHILIEENAGKLKTKILWLIQY